MALYRVVKYQALGNDYLILDPNRNASLPGREEIIRLCDRHYGFGADGLLLGPVEMSADRFSLQLYNPDGSAFEKSGNGLRIFARYIYDETYCSRRHFFLQTPGESLEAEIGDGEDIRIAIGRAEFSSLKIQATGHDRRIINEDLLVRDRVYPINAVSVGNPHCVVFRDVLDEEEIKNYGPFFENHHIFPQRINVQFVKVLDRKNLQILIWERGAGFTLASGTSSCAAFAVAQSAGLVDEDVTVHMPGGQLRVVRDAKKVIWLSGPAEKVYEGEASV